MTDIKQDTTAAAQQAIADQAPGSEFNPPPHPEEARIRAELAVCERKQTELFKKLYSGPPGTYMEREEWHEELREVDAAAAAWRRYLSEIALGYKGGQLDGPYAGYSTVAY